MELKANFPSIIPEPTEEELAQVLIEFYQRGQSEAKPVPPPAPFEITSSVVQPVSSVVPSTVKQDAPPMVFQPPALINPEDEVDFIGTNVAGYFPPTKTFTFDFFMRAHNPNEKLVTGPVYIRVYSAYAEVRYQVPGSGGHYIIIRSPGYANFNRAEFDIPPDGSEAYVRCAIYFPAIPAPSDIYTFGYVFIPMFVEYVDDGSDMEHIYGSGLTPPATWYYPPPRSIALYMDFQF
jgi:hypothetical protein